MEGSEKIHRIERSNLVDNVTQQLIVLIEKGIWKEGEKVPSENQMAKEFNVGRGVIREALQRLRSQNMVVTHHGLGSFVSNPDNFTGKDNTFEKLDLSESDFKSLCDLRACIETRAVMLAVRNGNEADFNQICAALREMETCAAERDLDKFTVADLRFHVSIVESSHSPMLIKAYTSCRKEIYNVLWQMNSVQNSYGYALRTHRKIRDAICERDSDQALQVMENMQMFNNVRYSSLLKTD